MRTSTITIIKIIFPLATVGCFFGGIWAYADGKDDAGTTLLFLAGISCFLMIAVFELFDGSYGIATTMGVFGLILVCLMVNNIQGRTQPVITDYHLLAAAHSDGPYELTDSHMHCSPITDDYSFHCIGWKKEISRYDRCSLCGRRFLDHYEVVIPSEEWQSKVRRVRDQREAWTNTVER